MLWIAVEGAGTVCDGDYSVFFWTVDRLPPPIADHSLPLQVDRTRIACIVITVIPTIGTATTGIWERLLRLVAFRRATTCNSMHSIAKAFLSVCLSVWHTCALWENDRNLCPQSCTTWKNVHPSSLTRRMVGGGQPLLPEIWVQTDPVGAKTPIFNRYSLVAPYP